MTVPAFANASGDLYDSGACRVVLLGPVLQPSIFPVLRCSRIAARRRRGSPYMRFILISMYLPVISRQMCWPRHPGQCTDVRLDSLASPPFLQLDYLVY